MKHVSCCALAFPWRFTSTTKTECEIRVLSFRFMQLEQSLISDAYASQMAILGGFSYGPNWFDT